MTAAIAVPAPDVESSANERLKSRFRSLFWSSIMLATLVHFGAFAFWPSLTTADYTLTAEELTAIELPPDIEIPPPPAQIVRPATPVIAEAAIDEDITIAPTTFEMNPVEDLALAPPPQEAAVDVGAAPTFTPFTVAPAILNVEAVRQAMVDSYPPVLRSAGIGGTVRVFFFIDENGSVEDYRIQQSSGYQQLDDAALAVAGLYRFSPALNRDRKVPVWVLFPIEFKVK
ncbi:MAG TPA: TonB family protein [Longimicrobiales bacterium]|nr:TonB family protein [Longimicrobiales bacterium]